MIYGSRKNTEFFFFFNLREPKFESVNFKAFKLQKSYESILKRTTYFTYMTKFSTSKLVLSFLSLAPERKKKNATTKPLQIVNATSASSFYGLSTPQKIKNKTNDVE